MDVILMLREYILRAQKHNRSLVHQHNMEMNIPLAVETNLWDSAPNTAVWDASQLSNTLQKVCLIAGEFAEVKFLQRAEWSGNQALMHKHDFNNTTIFAPPTSLNLEWVWGWENNLVACWVHTKVRNQLPVATGDSLGVTATMPFGVFFNHYVRLIN